MQFLKFLLPHPFSILGPQLAGGPPFLRSDFFIFTPSLIPLLGFKLPL